MISNNFKLPSFQSKTCFMKNEDYSKISLEELKKKEKSAQLATSLLIGMIIVQFIVGVFLTMTQGFSVFTIMPAIFLPIAVLSYNNLKKIKEAIASKNR